MGPPPPPPEAKAGRANVAHPARRAGAAVRRVRCETTLRSEAARQRGPVPQRNAATRRQAHPAKIFLLRPARWNMRPRGTGTGSSRRNRGRWGKGRARRSRVRRCARRKLLGHGLTAWCPQWGDEGTGDAGRRGRRQKGKKDDGGGRRSTLPH